MHKTINRRASRPLPKAAAKSLRLLRDNGDTMIMLMLNNRDTLINIIREQLTNIFRLVNRSLF